MGAKFNLKSVPDNYIIDNSVITDILAFAHQVSKYCLTPFCLYNLYKATHNKVSLGANKRFSILTAGYVLKTE